MNHENHVAVAVGIFAGIFSACLDHAAPTVAHILIAAGTAFATGFLAKLGAVAANRLQPPKKSDDGE